MAATAWLFGAEHFSHDENLWGSIVVGAILLAVYWAVSGIAFTAVAERVHPQLTTAWAIVAGAAWSFNASTRTTTSRSRRTTSAGVSGSRARALSKRRRTVGR